MAEVIPDVIDPERPAWLVCATGYRATIAGGLLRRHGMAVKVYAGGGVNEVMRVSDTSDLPCDLPLITAGV